MTDSATGRAGKLEALGKSIGALTAFLVALGAALTAVDKLKADVLLSPLAIVVVLILLGGTIGIYLLQRREVPSRIRDARQLRLSATDRQSLQGREGTIQQFLPVIASRQLLFLEGESGVGKSALVRHGLIPALKDDPTREAIVVSLWQQGAADESIGKALLMNLPDHGAEGAVNGPLRARLQAACSAQSKRLFIFFDQFDDYIGEHLRKFQRGDGTLISCEELCEQSPSWAAIRGLLKNPRISMVFVTREDKHSGLDIVRFQQAPTLTIERIPGSAMQDILDRLTVDNPGGDWEQLKLRIIGDTRGFLLPQQIKLMLGGLGFLRPLTEAQLDREGGAPGLEALYVRGLASTAASSAGAPVRDVLHYLGLMVSADQRTLLSIELPPGPQGKRLSSAFEVLRGHEITRATGDGKWTLFHDYLCRSVHLIRLSLDRSASLRERIRRACEAYKQDAWGWLGLPRHAISFVDQVRYWRASKSLPAADERELRRFVLRSGGLSALFAGTIVASLALLFCLGRYAAIAYFTEPRMDEIEVLGVPRYNIYEYWASDAVDYMLDRLDDERLWQEESSGVRGRRANNYVKYFQSLGPAIVDQVCNRESGASSSRPLFTVQALLCGLSPARQASLGAGPARGLYDLLSTVSDKKSQKSVRARFVSRSLERAAIFGVDDLATTIEWAAHLACAGTIDGRRDLDLTPYNEGLGALAKDLIIASRELSWYDRLRGRLLPRVQQQLMASDSEQVRGTCAKVYLYLHDRGRTLPGQEVHDSESASLVWRSMRRFVDGSGAPDRDTVKLLLAVGPALAGTMRVQLIERLVRLRQQAQDAEVKNMLTLRLRTIGFAGLSAGERHGLYCDALGKLRTMTDPFAMYRIYHWVHELKAPCSPALEDLFIAHLESLERDAEFVSSRLLFQSTLFRAAGGAGREPGEQLQLAARTIQSIKTILGDSKELKAIDDTLAEIVAQLSRDTLSPAEMCVLLDALRSQANSNYITEVRDLVRKGVIDRGHECGLDGERVVARPLPRRGVEPGK